MRGPVTVGIDIGTSSVKALAADENGTVISQSRIPHEIQIPAADQFQHDPAVAWCEGPRAALAALDLAEAPAGISVSAMVPSIAAVDSDGRPLTPGLLYGDARGQGGPSSGNPAESGELVNFLRWANAAAPAAAGFWPATTMANHALAGEAVIDTTTASVAYPLFDWTAWDPAVAAEVGIRTDQLPRIVPTGWACGHVGGPDGPVLAPGCIDVITDQIVAGAREVGDVLILMGTTLIVNTVTSRHGPVPEHWVMPFTEPGLFLAGGPSNAGGLFVNWATRGTDPTRPGATHPDRVPVWAPYPRGERVPLHDSTRRATLTDLDLTHGPAEIRRAAFEASGFVARRMIEAVGAAHGVTPRRIVATGGGTRVQEWVQAIADCTGLAVQCTAVPEGAALGSAFLARLAAGLEDGGMTDARRWARAGRTVDPDPVWAEALERRYQRFVELSA
ncbi:MAG: xylulose kinase [Acidimicrobiia bacterium]|nr:xylulose kinase [Acidimicrobiia bacterium]